MYDSFLQFHTPPLPLINLEAKIETPEFPEVNMYNVTNQAYLLMQFKLMGSAC